MGMLVGCMSKRNICQEQEEYLRRSKRNICAGARGIVAKNTLWQEYRVAVEGDIEAELPVADFLEEGGGVRAVDLLHLRVVDGLLGDILVSIQNK